MSRRWIVATGHPGVGCVSCVQMEKEGEETSDFYSDENLNKRAELSEHKAVVATSLKVRPRGGRLVRLRDAYLALVSSGTL